MTARVDVIGYLGKVSTGVDGQGHPYLRSSVAHSTSFTKKDSQEVENTTWFNFTIWNAKAIEQFNDKLNSGDLVHVAGEPTFRAYNNNGEMRADFGINLGFNGTFEVLRYKGSLLAKEKAAAGEMPADPSGDNAIPI